MGKVNLTELAFIALGSNIEPEKNLPLAVKSLATLGRLVACSQVYQNPAIAREPQPDYLNAAILLATELQPLELREKLRQIESSLGRIRTADKYAARTIDLDLSLYGESILETPELILPDPEILTRPHLAVTLADLDPDQKYPGSDRKLGEIASALSAQAALSHRTDLSLSEYLADPKEHPYG